MKKRFGNFTNLKDMQIMTLLNLKLYCTLIAVIYEKKERQGVDELLVHGPIAAPFPKVRPKKFFQLPYFAN